MAEKRISSYDVAVVGAGPAGAVAAAELAGAGAKVLLLEKDKLPRYKACAGGITYRAASILGFDINPLAERVIYGVRLSYKFGHRLTRTYGKPVIYTVSRENFDQLLVEKAQQAGAEFLDNMKVAAIEDVGNKMRLSINGQTFMADVVIGADGANSVVARGLGLDGGFYYGVGLEAEVYASEAEIDRWRDMVGLDFGVIPGGYCWLFPKEDHLSIGVGTPQSHAALLRPCLEKMIKSYNLSGSEIRIMRGARLPVRRHKAPIINGRGMLIGDAAGLTDAVTGEGIYYAVKSAQLAVPAALDYLGGKSDSLKPYQQAVDAEMMEELGVCRALERICILTNTHTPSLFFKCIVESERVWDAFCRIVRGEKTYSSLKRRLGPFRFLFNLLTH